MLVVVLENSDRFAIRLTEQISFPAGDFPRVRVLRCASLCWKMRIPRQHLTYFVQSGQFPRHSRRARSG